MVTPRLAMFTMELLKRVSEDANGGQPNQDSIRYHPQRKNIMVRHCHFKVRTKCPKKNTVQEVISFSLTGVFSISKIDKLLIVSTC